MNQRDFAERLLAISAEQRTKFIIGNRNLCNSRLGKVFQDICYEIWTNKPQEVSGIVDTLSEIVAIIGDNSILPYVEWVNGFKDLINGNLEKCVARINESEKCFLFLNQRHEAATTLTTKVTALAMLGRYDEAVKCGLLARGVFLEFSDFYSAGKIEHNIGNLYWRRDLYRESEPFLASAHERFLLLGDERQLAMVENCQAFVKGLQNNFREAEAIYMKARKRCVENDFTVTEAEIEIGMSNLYLFQSRFDLALKFLESSRKKYDLLGMRHQSANCELEIADIYLELNLLPEARDFYSKAAITFSKTGMQAELGKCFLSLARISLVVNEIKESSELLEKAEKLFVAEGNEISIASVQFVKAQNFYRQNKIEAAKVFAESAAKTFKKGGNSRLEFLAMWLLGDIHSSANEIEKAIEIQTEIQKGTANIFPQIKYLSLVSLGKLTCDEAYFLEAIKLIESSRLLLSSEDIRTAFITDKLLPYHELVKINVRRKDFEKALIWSERSRSKTLLEEMEIQPDRHQGNEELNDLKQELNWLYSRLNRQSEGAFSERKDSQDLRHNVAILEKEYAEKLRRLTTNKNSLNLENVEFDLADLQSKLQETTMIEFIFIDQKLSVFLLSKNGLEFFENIATEEEVNTEIEQFIFQIKTGRFQHRLSVENRPIAVQRIISHSKRLFDVLIRPLLKSIHTKRLAIIPSKVLHYLPFQALHDGEKSLIEAFEISYSPSASVLQACLNREIDSRKSALLVGLEDKVTPMVASEINMIGELFEKSVKLLNQNATLKNLRENLSEIAILHLACHGKFRPDNPSFSSLSLFNESLTVADAQTLDLKNRVVVLSACETGLNKIVPGEELIGLARGFLKSGASSLVLSLWTIDDAATLEFMTIFYKEFLLGKSLSAAIQIAQIQQLSRHSHPYFWSPFVLIGHW
jgi:CHAT domain-containing protein